LLRAQRPDQMEKVLHTYLSNHQSKKHTIEKEISAFTN
jgi:hypothetical protein